MKKFFELKILANVTGATILIGCLVFTLGFGWCLYLASNRIEIETDQKVQREIEYVQGFVFDQLQRVEDAAYLCVSQAFGNTVRTGDGRGYVSIDTKNLHIPSEKECFESLQNFLEATPYLCGVAIGFEDFVYPLTKDKYGFAAYVTNVGGKYESLALGRIHDFHLKDWYKKTYEADSPMWGNPFHETSNGKVVVNYSLPLHGFNNRIVGVLAVDIDTEKFRKMCDEINPLPNSIVTIVDKNMRYVAHPDTAALLKTIIEVGDGDNDIKDELLKTKMIETQKSGRCVIDEGGNNESVFYFAPIEKTGWTVSIECSREEIYAGVSQMRRDTTMIAIVCIAIMIVCFAMVFLKMNSVTEAQASIQRELSIASKIQLGMLPKGYPVFPDRKDIDVYGFLRPAKSVGGDLYDYFINEEKLFMCIGDVAGKGVPASLYMSTVLSLFRNVVNHTHKTHEIVSELNNACSYKNEHNMFCTLLVCVIDLQTGELEYCNAGHNAPVIKEMIGDECSIEFANVEKNLPIGVVPDFPYMSKSIQLKQGDVVFLYTDGVTEAENIEKELFGEDALLQSLEEAREYSVRTAKDFVDYVLNEIEKFTKGTEQSDDITMLVMSYKNNV